MDDFGLTMLPVVDGNAFLAVVTKAGCRRGEGDSPKVEQVMSQPSLTVGPEFDVATLFEAMTRYEVLCVPVLDDGQVIGIPLLAGRTFTSADTATSQRVVVIDEFLAKRQFAGIDPVGRQLNFGSPRNYTIVGVVGTINGGDVAVAVPEERIYFTVAQVAQPLMGILLKSGVDAASLAPQVRAAVQAIDAGRAISDVRTLEDRFSQALQPRRMPATLLSLFGAIALLLAAIGIYGVLAFGVSERVREFGIRQALGADRASILSLVLGQGLRTAGAGLVLGLAGALVLGRYLQSLLFGVTAHDVSVFAIATSILLVVALLACYLPARRATRVEPIEALRL